MKKLLLICLTITLFSCKAMMYNEAKFDIGMPESEFKQANRSAELVSSASDGTNIYRTYVNSFVPKEEPYSFFYFYQGKLTRFIKSNRADDYKFIM